MNQPKEFPTFNKDQAEVWQEEQEFFETLIHKAEGKIPTVKPAFEEGEEWENSFGDGEI